jgi:hypothetical protein
VLKECVCVQEGKSLEEQALEALTIILCQEVRHLTHIP